MKKNVKNERNTDKNRFFFDDCNCLIDILQNQILFNKNSSKINLKKSIILDLDGTIFDNFHRQILILREIITKSYPELFHIINFDMLLTLSPTPYSIISYLKKNYPTLHEIDLIQKDFDALFLSSRYLNKDVPYKGIDSFIQIVSSLGYEIIFLTGRPYHQMYSGTINSLKNWNLIPKNQNYILIMKPSADLDDFRFKYHALTQLKHDNTRKIFAFFDNESANCRLAKQIFPQALIVKFISNESHYVRFNGQKLRSWLNSY